MRRHRTSVPHGQLFTAKDLSFKIARDVKIYLLMCLVFYVSIPVIYYHIHLDYTMVDAFYVSVSRSLWHICKSNNSLLGVPLTQFLCFRAVLYGNSFAW
jgi:hypothetical protein